jgi:hypothetical protein
MIASSQGLDSRHEVDLIAGGALKLERLSRVAIDGSCTTGNPRMFAC